MSGSRKVIFVQFPKSYFCPVPEKLFLSGSRKFWSAVRRDEREENGTESAADCDRNNAAFVSDENIQTRRSRRVK
jgi:hypothetical protein